MLNNNNRCLAGSLKRLVHTDSKMTGTLCTRAAETDIPATKSSTADHKTGVT